MFSESDQTGIVLIAPQNVLEFFINIKNPPIEAVTK